MGFLLVYFLLLSERLDMRLQIVAYMQLVKQPTKQKSIIISFPILFHVRHAHLLRFTAAPPPSVDGGKDVFRFFALDFVP